MTVIEQRYMDAVIDYCLRDKKIDWEERKFQLASEIYKQIIDGIEDSPCKDNAIDAINAAEKFIETYKKMTLCFPNH